jgi:cytochrome P450
MTTEEVTMKAATSEPGAHTYPFGEADELQLSPEYAEVRAEEPLTPIHMAYGPDGWLVTRHDDVRKVLSDRRFSNALRVNADIPRAIPDRITRGADLFNLDAPEHNRVRRLIAPYLTPKRAEALRPWVEEVVDGLIDDMIAAGSPVDLVPALTEAVPISVVCRLLGAPESDRHVFREGAEGLISNRAVPAEVRAAALEKLYAYIRTLIAARRGNLDGPGDDVLGDLIRARDEDGNRLAEQELVGLCRTFFTAGHETTMNVSGNVVMLLQQDRSRWDRLVENPGQIPTVLEELLRWIPTDVYAQNVRVAKEDIEMFGGLVHAGEGVLPSTAAGNRDPEVYANPDEIDLDRDLSRVGHLSFGFGPHICPGQYVARVEIQSIIRGLVKRLPSLEIEEIEWRTTSVVRGAKRLVVRW